MLRPSALNQPHGSRAAAGQVLATQAQVPGDRRVVWFSGGQRRQQDAVPPLPCRGDRLCRQPGVRSCWRLASGTGFNPRAVGEPLCHEGSGTAPVPLLSLSTCVQLEKHCPWVHPASSHGGLVPKVGTAGGVVRGGKGPQPARIWPGLFPARTGRREEEKVWVQQGPAAPAC